MTKKVSRLISLIMLVLAGIFVFYVLGRPNLSFPWSNGITYTIYGVYIAVMLLFYAAPFAKKE